MESSSLTYFIKVSFGDDLRRISFTGNDFSLLEKQLCQLFSLNVPIKVCYLDDEKEWITMSSSNELSLALQLIKAPNPLRLSIVPLQTSPNNFQVSPPNVPNVVPNFVPDAKSQDVLYPPLSPIKVEQPSACSPYHKMKHSGREGKKNHFEKHLKPKLRFVTDLSPNPEQKFLPGQSFVKTFRIRNEGMVAWQNYSIKFKKGEQMTTTSSFLVPLVSPGQEIDVSLPMTAPTSSGKFISIWKLVNDLGIPFGNSLKIKIRVQGPNESSSSSSEEDFGKKKLKRNWFAFESAYSDQLASLSQMGFNDRKKNLKLLIKMEGNLDKVIVKLLKKCNKTK